MSSTIKPLIVAVLATSIFVTVALAVDTSFKTRLITSSTLTIHVKDGEFITIRNFTQDQDVGQRGVIVAGLPAPSPTPTPTATPTSTPISTPTSTDLTATKTDNVGGQATFPNQWTWKIHVANGGNTPAAFSLFDVILTDNLPSSNLNYGSASITNLVNISNINAINCTISGSDLTCSATDAVTIGAGGSFDVSFTATPSAAGSYGNPRAGGDCSVDPNNVVAESDDSNNTCSDTVVSNAPTTVSGTILTASISYTDTSFIAEFIEPIVVAGPATLTIDPIPPATLSITYRKSLQPIQPSPSPTP